MLRIKSLLLLLTTLLAAQLPMTAATVTYGVGACGQVGLTSFATISDALAATPAPNVIEVCPGIYPEQVVITIPVTIEGILVNGEGQVSLVAPSGGLKTNAADAFGTPVATQVWVYNATGPVNISNIDFDGSANEISSDSQSAIVGVFYENSSGTLNHLETRFQQGNGSGVGVWVEGGNSNPSVTVENSNMHNFELAGILAEGGLYTLTAEIEDDSIIGGTRALRAFILTRASLCMGKCP